MLLTICSRMFNLLPALILVYGFGTDEENGRLMMLMLPRYDALLT